MQKIFQFITREILYMGHIQAIGAAAIVYLSAAIFILPISIELLLATYFLFQSIYYFDRLKDIDRDGDTNPVRTNHLRTYRSIIPTVIAGYLGVALILFISTQSLSLILLAVIITVFGFLYPIFFKALTGKIRLFKDFYVASVFSVLVFFPHLLMHYPIPVNSLMLGFVGFIFIESVIMQLILDLKDAKSDARQGLQTLPTSVGWGNTTTYIFALSIGLSGIIIGFGIIHALPSLLTTLAIATLLFNLLVLTAIKQKHSWGFLLGSAKYLYWLIIIILLQYG